MTTPLQLVGDDRNAELTVAEAATRYGVSSTTIRRRLKERPTSDGRRRAMALPNAHQDETGTWMIPVDDLETAQFTSGTHVDTSGDNHAANVAEPPTAMDLRDQLAEARQRVAVAEAVATGARRELVERLADKDEIIRVTRETIETQNGTITALAREVEDKDHRLALMEKRVDALDAAPLGRYTGVADWEPSVATDPDETDPVPVGELRRRLADRQPPPRRWWQRIRRA